jgi:hypothetical protein
MPLKEKHTRVFLDARVITRGIDGILETVAAFVLLFSSTARLHAITNFFLQAELGERSAFLRKAKERQS